MLIPPNTRDLRPLVDLALIQPGATRSDVEKLCRMAAEHKLRAVCVNGSNVLQAYALLNDSDVKVIATVGFPFGAMDADTKRFEAETAVDQDAHEIEVVLNIGRMRDGDTDYVLRELRDVCEAADERPVNVVIESDLLSDNERKLACALAIDSGAQCISTNSGFSGRPTAQLVRTIRSEIGQKFLLKATPIADLNSAIAMIEAGATRIGLFATPALNLALRV
jgi:deoxyribose-phosphate aldolase